MGSFKEGLICHTRRDVLFKPFSWENEQLEDK